ncbi:MAG TPA: hypothetical protein VG146_17690 [Verrucomicrobiae bacterium]|nr:hypothetical protein [Verrucomicrobiae bacterium]
MTTMTRRTTTGTPSSFHAEPPPDSSSSLSPSEAPSLTAINPIHAMPLNPWHALEEIPTLSAFRHQWRKRIGGDPVPLEALCLQPSQWRPTLHLCQSCGRNHQIILRYDGSGAIAVSTSQTSPCPDIELTKEQITPLEVSWTRLGRALCKALGLNNKFARLQPPETVQFGAWSSDAVPAILTIQNSLSEFRSSVAQVAALLRRPFLLFAPTSDLLDAPSQTILQNYGAGFFPLDATVTLDAQGNLTPRQPPERMFIRFTPERDKSPSTTIHKPRYALRKGLGVWHLIFDGKEADIRHEKGLFYVAWLLYHPDQTPIHALDLMAKIPEIYREQLGLAPLTDPSTGKTVTLESQARIQERSLALDDRESMRRLYKKQKELEAILDSDDASEPEKAEALRELEAIYDYQKHHTTRTHDAAQKAARNVRQAIGRLLHRLQIAIGHTGTTHPAMRPFALHLQNHLTTPSAKSPPGTFTYTPPRHYPGAHKSKGVRWRPEYGFHGVGVMTRQRSVSSSTCLVYFFIEAKPVSSPNVELVPKEMFMP